MVEIIINDKYIIKNVLFNDQIFIPGVMAECFLRVPTDEDIKLVARFEEEVCHIKVKEGDKTLLSVHGIFYEVIVNEHIDFLIKKEEKIIHKDYIEWFDDKIGYYQENVPDPCKRCSNHPSNGGSGICHCTLPYFMKTGSPIGNTPIIYYTKEINYDGQ